jgi:uncharacterized protein YaiL (DUF2058 family)
MSMSLRDQLLAAGLGSKQQAKRADQDQRRENKQARRDGGAGKGGRPPASQAAAAAAERARAEKAARDRELNRKQQESAEARARLGLVRQWADRDRLPPLDSDESFNFVDEGKVRRVRVDAERRAQLLAGSVVIVRVGDRYEQLPAAAAARIRERVPEAVIDVSGPTPGPGAAAPGVGGTAAGTADAEDPYKDFVVPDDLTW